jgi:transcriptional regulator with XRE-family HTH domain
MASSSTFGERLRSYREEAGLSQYALAKKSGLTKQAVSRLEGGTRHPGWETVQRLVLALGLEFTAFADKAIELPQLGPARPRGRPRKKPTEAPSA